MRKLLQYFGLTTLTFLSFTASSAIILSDSDFTKPAKHLVEWEVPIRLAAIVANDEVIELRRSRFVDMAQILTSSYFSNGFSRQLHVRSKKEVLFDKSSSASNARFSGSVSAKSAYSTKLNIAQSRPVSPLSAIEQTEKASLGYENAVSETPSLQTFVIERKRAITKQAIAKGVDFEAFDVGNALNTSVDIIEVTDLVSESSDKNIFADVEASELTKANEKLIETSQLHVTTIGQQIPQEAYVPEHTATFSNYNLPLSRLQSIIDTIMKVDDGFDNELVNLPEAFLMPSDTIAQPVNQTVSKTLPVIEAKSHSIRAREDFSEPSPFVIDDESLMTFVNSAGISFPEVYRGPNLNTSSLSNVLQPTNTFDVSEPPSFLIMLAFLVLLGLLNASLGRSESRN